MSGGLLILSHPHSLEWVENNLDLRGGAVDQKKEIEEEEVEIKQIRVGDRRGWSSFKLSSELVGDEADRSTGKGKGVA